MPDAQVLILGGGMTGVAAANRLTELGITDFIILEGQDRLGGGGKICSFLFVSIFTDFLLEILKDFKKIECFGCNTFCMGKYQNFLLKYWKWERFILTSRYLWKIHS